jgi:hypothetical protein
VRYNHKTTQDAIEYVQSEKYDDKYLTTETQLKKIAEKAVRGEIPLEVWQQLRADLQIGHPENKKKSDLVGYG